VLRLLNVEDDEYLHDELLKLNKSEARVILLYATKYDVAMLIVVAIITIYTVNHKKVAEHL